MVRGSLGTYWGSFNQYKRNVPHAHIQETVCLVMLGAVMTMGWKPWMTKVKKMSNQSFSPSGAFLGGHSFSSEH